MRQSVFRMKVKVSLRECAEHTLFFRKRKHIGKANALRAERLNKSEDIREMEEQRKQKSNERKSNERKSNKRTSSKQKLGEKKLPEQKPDGKKKITVKRHIEKAAKLSQVSCP